MEHEADWYDANSDEVCKPLLQSPWLGLYALLAGWIQSVADVDNCHGVVDIGAGPGRLGELLLARDYPHPYTGFDFSKRCLQEAETYVVEGDVRVPAERAGMYAEPGVIVFSEILEHLDHHIDVVGDVPYDRFVIITGPNFESAAHVRHFVGMEHFVSTYETLLQEVRLVGAVSVSPPLGRSIYALAGYRGH